MWAASSPHPSDSASPGGVRSMVVAVLFGPDAARPSCAAGTHVMVMAMLGGPDSAAAAGSLTGKRQDTHNQRRENGAAHGNHQETRLALVLLGFAAALEFPAASAGARVVSSGLRHELFLARGSHPSIPRTLYLKLDMGHKWATDC